MNPYERFLGKEDMIHIAVCRYVRLQYPKAVLHHSPNEGKRSKFERYKLSMLNVSSGFPDLVICLKSRVIAIELKSEKGRATEKQAEWIETLRACNIPSAVCVGFDEARAFIDEQFKQAA